MATELVKNWTSALELLKHDIAEISYETWIAPLKPHSYNEESGVFSLVLPGGVPDNYVTRYSEAIERALTVVYRKPVTPAFLRSEDLPRERKSLQTDNIFTDEFYLNPRYIFSSFVVGKNNQLAWATAQAVATMPGKTYNPLFIYGGSGLGKTHLMHAIGHQIQKTTKKKVLYVSSEMFTNEFIKALTIGKRSGMEEFRTKYRKVDVLLLDDVQFLGGKKETQEEFFHTFEDLYNDHKQIVLTADKMPNEIDGLEERLVTRFAWGLSVDIEPPEFETRVAILRKKAEQDEIEITEELSDVFTLIAEHVHSNIRELEGALNRVIAYSNIMGHPVTKQLAREALRDIFTDEAAVITPANIKKVIARHYGIKIQDLDGSSRARSISYPRQIAMYLCKELTDCSYPKIGDSFGGRDHTTVIHACKTIQKDLCEQEHLKELIEKFRKELNEE